MPIQDTRATIIPLSSRIYFPISENLHFKFMLWSKKLAAEYSDVETCSEVVQLRNLYQ
jgi:hypothetical protein